MIRRLSEAIPRLLTGALCGLLTAAAALGAGQLAAGITGPLTSPVLAVGESSIGLTPVPVKEFAIAHFGSHDKQALITGILVVLAGCAVLAGILALYRLAFGLAILGAFGAAGVAAAITRPGASPVSVVPALVSTAIAAAALTVLTRAAGRCLPAAGHPAADLPAPPAPGEPYAPGEPPAPSELPAPGEPAVTGAPAAPGDLSAGRRQFLLTGAGVAALAAAGGASGQLLLRRFSATSSRAAVKLPAATVTAPPVPAGTELRIPGITPFFTPDGTFYRVDTDLVLPQVSAQSWTLRVDGMVSRPFEISFDELLAMPLTEADVTLVCVSNQVGGPYAGNARWLGASLAALLRRARVRAGADQVLSSATDGMTISTPLRTIMNEKNSLLAVGMNGKPLPVAHGFPARMIVPGLFGYVSATKWVTRLTVTTFASRQAYWTKRGYAARAPIKTESRIDVPRPLASLAAGPVQVAGVAWAPTRGISKVEVSVDGGSWHTARLATADNPETWRQWSWTWHASPGLHRLRVRATDSSGVTQTPSEKAAFPDGASGWDSAVVTVT